MAAFFGLVTTSVRRCGSLLYCPISTRLGSTRIIRTWSGVDRIRIDVSSEFRHEDLPAPVAPAIRMWGMPARLAMTAWPSMSRPMATSSGCVAALASALARMSPTVTSCLRMFGISMPIACLPGMGARIRTSGVAIA